MIIRIFAWIIVFVPFAGIGIIIKLIYNWTYKQERDITKTMNFFSPFRPDKSYMDDKWMAWVFIGVVNMIVTGLLIGVATGGITA